MSWPKFWTSSGIQMYVISLQWRTRNSCENISRTCTIIRKHCIRMPNTLPAQDIRYPMYQKSQAGMLILRMQYLLKEATKALSRILIRILQILWKQVFLLPLQKFNQILTQSRECLTYWTLYKMTQINFQAT
jgi:hypothetical protein